MLNTENTSKVSLPFTTTDDGKICYWAVEGSGEWGADNATGRGHADALIADMKATDFPGTLAHVVHAMIDRGTFGGVEVGFLNQIAQRTLV